jgi:hypothetical protein
VHYLFRVGFLIPSAVETRARNIWAVSSCSLSWSTYTIIGQGVYWPGQDHHAYQPRRSLRCWVRGRRWYLPSLQESKRLLLSRSNWRSRAHPLRGPLRVHQFVYDPHLAPFLEELALRYLHSRGHDYQTVPVLASSGDADRTPPLRSQPGGWDEPGYEDDFPAMSSNGRVRSTHECRPLVMERASHKRRPSSPQMAEEEAIGITSSLSMPLSAGEARQRKPVGTGSALQSLVDEVVSPCIPKARTSTSRSPSIKTPQLPLSPPRSERLPLPAQAPDTMVNSIPSLGPHEFFPCSSASSLIAYSIVEQPRNIDFQEPPMVASSTLSASSTGRRSRESSRQWTAVSAVEDAQEQRVVTPTPGTISPFTVTSSVAGDSRLSRESSHQWTAVSAAGDAQEQRVAAATLDTISPFTVTSSVAGDSRLSRESSHQWTAVSADGNAQEQRVATATPGTMSPFTVTSSVPGSPATSYAHMSPQTWPTELPIPMEFPPLNNPSTTCTMTDGSWQDAEALSEYGP